MNYLKNTIKKFPNISRLVIGTLLIVIALIFTTYFNPFPKLFPFVGVITLVVANGIMFYSENKDLSDIGLNLNLKNVSFLFFGLILGILAMLIGYVLLPFLTGDKLQFSKSINYLAILKQFYWILPTAAVQELICRGYLYKKLISTTNLTIANILMSLVFVSMHDVFGIGIFGALMYSISIVIGHLVFANALLKSGTLLFSIGIHWGSNIANNKLFTSEKLNTSIFYLNKAIQEEPTGFNPLGILLYIVCLNIGFIGLAICLWKWKTVNR